MKSRLLLIPALAFALLSGTRHANAQESYYGQPQFGYDRHQAVEAWEQRGFYEGAKGADRDYWNHRRPDVNNRDEYRDLDDVPGWARHEYREGFRRGYYERVRQIYHRDRWRGDDDDR